jgi:phosphate transport system protein
MSALAEKMIHDAVQVLVSRDAALAGNIRSHEGDVNRMQVEIDELCLELIATQQPAARDLRFILGVAKTNAELERLSDQAVNILEKAEDLINEPPLQQFSVIQEMARVAAEMLKDSLHAFVNEDVEKARFVLMRDDQVDNMKATVTKDLLECMKNDPSAINRALTLILIVRNLERIGDHATNIAENIIFVVQGRDIRHHMGSQ